MQRTIFGRDHELFRDMIRDFLEREVVPVFPEWEAAEAIPRDFFRTLGEVGVMGMNMPAEFGGGGQSDYTYNVILQEEAARLAVSLGSLRTHLDVVLPYFRAYTSNEQKRRWFEGIVSGDL